MRKEETSSGSSGSSGTKGSAEMRRGRAWQRRTRGNVSFEFPRVSAGTIRGRAGRCRGPGGGPSASRDQRGNSDRQFSSGHQPPGLTFVTSAEAARDTRYSFTTSSAGQLIVAARGPRGRRSLTATAAAHASLRLTERAVNLHDIVDMAPDAGPRYFPGHPCRRPCRSMRPSSRWPAPARLACRNTLPIAPSQQPQWSTAGVLEALAPPRTPFPALPARPGWRVSRLQVGDVR